jgi:signal transduction histidine kinase
MTPLEYIRFELAPKPQFLDQKLEAHRWFMLLMAAMGAVTGPLMWSWDYVTDPIGAQQTIVLRLLMLTTIGGAISLYFLKNRRLLAPLSVGWVVWGEIVFVEILKHLHGGMVHGLGGFLFFLLLSTVMLLGFSLQVNLCATLIFTLLPHLFGALGWISDFPHAQYAVLLWPAMGLTAISQGAFSLSYKLRYDANAALLVANQELARAADANLQAYQELQQMQAKLVAQEKLAALGSLVAAIAHELNTPIGNVLMVSSTLQEQTDAINANMANKTMLRSELERYLHASQEANGLIMRNLSSAATLIANFKQVAVDRSSMTCQQFDLHRFCHEATATRLSQIRAAGHSLALDVPPDIWMHSDPIPLGQVLIHILDNALLHAFGEGQAGQIRVSAVAINDDMVHIRIADNGCGIAEADQKRIFEPFFTTKMGQGGSGLGLHISYNLVTALLGGQILLESTPGQGSCLTLELPRTAPCLAERRIAQGAS